MLPTRAKRVLLAMVAVAALPCFAAELPPLDDPETFARRLTSEVGPGSLNAYLILHPDQIPAVFRTIGAALMTDDAALRAGLETFLTHFHRMHARRERDLRVVVSLLLVDPNRFLKEEAFRARVLSFLPRALDGQTSFDVRMACLRELHQNIGLDYDTVERIGVGWGAARRTSADLRVPFSGELRVPDDLSGPIQTSIYSLSSQFFTTEEAVAFISAVRKAAPLRKVIVVVDPPLREALKGVNRIETFSGPFTPWPRDPFTPARSKDGAIVLVNRPNLQPDREEDANMVRALVQSAPLDARWTVAPVPFHNGHVLLTPDATWISIHTVEIRALELLGLKRVPVETFGTAAGIEKYLVAVRKAAKELEALYGRPVRFVHPLEADPELMRRLGGGGGLDLDSLLTLLPQSDGSMVALVGDLALGAEIALDADWSPYRVKGNVAAAQTSPRNVALSAFLDSIAAHLAKNGMKVSRLPLIHVPASMAADAPKDFLITWNNVVLEDNGKRRRAEGFASLLASGDAIVQKAFEGAGYELVLFPPLIRSVVLSGGYRCASSHIRP